MGAPPFLAHALFEAHAQAAPDACALITEQPVGPGRRLSYRELNQRANRLAHSLIARGARPGAIVGVCLPRFEELIVALLAVLKAGAAVLPVDPQYPPARQRLLLEDARAAVVVTEEDGSIPSQQTRHSTENPKAMVGVDDVASIIYTSGSTGRPKGVQILHRNWVHSTQARLQYYREPLIACLCVSSFSFDTAMGALLWALSAGGAFILAGEQTNRDPQRLVRLIAREKPTHSLWLPSLYELVLDQGSPGDLAALRVVIVGGETCPSRLVEKHAALLPSVPLYNEYGPTEATVWSTVHRCGRNETHTPIGRAIPGTRLALLDSNFASVNDGDVGELCIGGDGVTSGYLNQPELTAERFIEVPRLGRMYRSGDRGRRLPDGNLEFLGRVDNLVKVRGFRIELEEIESVLGRHEGVRQVCASVRSAADADSRLVVHFVPSEHSAHAAQMELVEQWRRVDDATYNQAGDPSDPAFNTIGWNDSYEGKPIPAEQMREWVLRTVDRIIDLLPSSARVLEVGCGTGLLLFQVAPACASYIGTDISQRALDTLAVQLEKVNGVKDKVSLRRCAAHELIGIAPGSVDVVVLNSVIQFFPSEAYLRDVLSSAVQAVAAGGAVFVGDVRPFSLLRAFRAGVELARAGSDRLLSDLQTRIAHSIENEEELLVDAEWFRAFAASHPRVSSVEIQLRRDCAQNEMTAFRYDVVLRVGDRAGADPEIPELVWGLNVDDIESVFRHVTQERSPGLIVRNVPNRRLRWEHHLLGALNQAAADSTVGDLRRAIQTAPEWGVDPELWWRRSAALGLNVQVAPALDAQTCTYDVLFTGQGATLRSGFSQRACDSNALANKPWWRPLTRKLAAELREHAEENLPAFMVPSAFVPVHTLPRTVTGKLDRAALPEPSGIVTGGSGRPVQSVLEHRIASVWQEVLQTAVSGAEDNFFELGGNSLLLLQVQAKLSRTLGRDIDLVTLFQYPTIASLARGLGGYRSEESSCGVPRSSKIVHECREPIAIIGMAGRFPGAASVEEFWRNLREGVHLVTYPEGSQNGERVKASGVLEDIDAFDAAFFGYSPSEAATLDPQQRVFLECAYTAVENAGYDPLRFSGRIGIYAGSDFNTYFFNNVCPNQGYDGPRTFLETAADMHVTLANASDFLATRVSYKLGLCGPSISVQTGCSTSLVAVHLACEALLSGSAEMALAGGVSIRAPQGTGYVYEEGSILSADGVCRAFDAAATGTVFGSGVGVVVLRRLSDALASGDRIRAVIRGTAVNNDGGAKAGFTAPSVDGQAEVIRLALERAGVHPESIGYVEAHGTGTALGDSIELAALMQVFGQNPLAGHFCALGSVKTNIGHLAHAAGVAGLIKAALAVEHGEIPPHLHYERPNPRIESSSSPFHVNTSLEAWANEVTPRRAGVSSFGMGGTNGHVILEQAPPLPSRPDCAERTAHLLTLSAKTPEALTDLVQRTAEFLSKNSDESFPDICATANTGRRTFEHRVAVVGSSQSELRRELLDATPARVPARVPRITFLFPGQGAQYARMGADLYDTQPVFREQMDRCDRILRERIDVSLLELLYGSAKDARLFRTDIGQPVLFSVEIALAALWKSWGVEPDAVMGHSLGEYAAAVVAGVLQLEDGLRIVAERGRLMTELSPKGAMASLSLGVNDAVRAIRGFDVSVAAINSPNQVVIAGTAEAVDAACASLRGVTIHRLPTGRAFHTPMMDPVLAPFGHVLRNIALSPPAMTFVSTVSGSVAGLEITDAGYWRDQIRQPVCFHSAMLAMRDRGVDVFLEVGPRTTLLSQGQACVPEEQATWLASMIEGQDSWRVLLESLGTLYLRGARVDMAAIERGFSRRRVQLPNYPFQRQRYWITPPRTRSSQETLVAHPLLGRRLNLPGSSEIRFEAELALGGRHRYLEDHRVEGRAVFPLSGYVEMVLAAGREVGSGRSLAIRDLAVERALTLAGPGVIQTVLDPDGEGSWSVRIFYRSNKDGEWVRHAAGRVGQSEAFSTPSFDGCRERCSQPASVDDLYTRLQQRGIEYGPSFRGVDALWQGTRTAFCRVRRRPELLCEDERKARTLLHPALLDTCFHALDLVLPAGTFLPSVVDYFEWFSDGGDGALWSFVERECEGDDATPVCSVSIFDEQGTPVAVCRGLMLRPLRDPAVPLDQSVYETRWVPRALPSAQPSAPSDWILCGNPGGLADKLARHLRAAGQRPTIYQEERDLQRWLKEANSGRGVRHVVHLWSLACGSGEDIEDWPQRISEMSRGWGTALALTQGLVAGALNPRLWIITRGAQVAGETAPLAVQQAPLWGLAKAIALEHPELRCTIVDLDTFTTDADAAAELASELLADDAERQIAYRNGRRLVARLQHVETATCLVIVPGQPVQVATAGRSLDDIRLRPLQRRAPGPGEVEIAVKAAGLNLRDVLTALGSLEAAGDDGMFGYECAGVVARVGAEVSGIAPGDAMIALARGSLASFVTTRTELVARKPRGLTFEQAATLPAAFLTAYYGLHTLAGVAPGERVLVHAAAGGVGQAAVQLARHAGAQVFGTASRGKWAALHASGVSKVLNSRTVDFADEVLRETNGHGVDVVLNSLNQERALYSLATLAQGGRFVELGKIDTLTDDEIRVLRPDVHSFSFDLGEISERAPAIIAHLFAKLVPLFERGVLSPLPYRVFPLGDVPRAFRFMAEAQQIGKVVLSVPDDHDAVRVRPDATYLITGGLGGLGLKVVRWLADRGATDLVLVSRRSNESGEALRAEALPQAPGVRVRIVQADVSQWEDIARVGAACTDRLPLRGIIHCAGVLEDGLLPHQTAASFQRVLAPKVDGAWNLHMLTRRSPLDFFVLFSSAASLTGSVGQAGYVAANAFLDALAYHRRALGLPALSVNWGAWDDVGMFARLSSAHQSRLAAIGVQRIDVEEGLELLGRLIARDPVQVGVMPLVWSRWLAQVPEDLPFFERVRPPSPTAPEQKVSPKPTLSQARSLVRKLAARTLGFDDPEMLSGSQSLLELGLDSLLALDLKSRLQNAFGRKLPTRLLFDHPSVDTIVDFLAGRGFPSGSCSTPSTVVAIRPYGAGAPLFFLPGVMGNAADLAQLGSILGAQRPFFALRSLGLEEGERPFTSVEEIAAHHLQSIQARYTNALCLLGGYSFGGVVAFEMARQLVARGCPAPLLFIVDIQAPGSPAERDADQCSDERAVDVMLQMIHRSLASDEAEFRRAVAVFRANMTAMNRYRPSARLAVEIVLVQAATRRTEFAILPGLDETRRDPTWGWGALSTLRTEVHVVPGDHFRIMTQPFVQRLADIVTKRLSARYVQSLVKPTKRATKL